MVLFKQADVIVSKPLKMKECSKNHLSLLLLTEVRYKGVAKAINVLNEEDTVDRIMVQQSKLSKKVDMFYEKMERQN